MRPLMLFILFFTALQLNAQSPKFQSIDVDVEVVRVKKQMREIQSLPIARDVKIQKQRTLLDHEMARAKSLMDKSSDSKETSDASRDRKKAGMANLQKFLDILRSMNAQI